MKIAFFEVPKVEQDVFSSFFSKQEVSFFEENFNEDNVSLAKDVEIISVFVNSEITKNMIDLLPNLKYIATRSTGFNHIDTDYCKTKGIKVSNVPCYGSYTVAEFTFALILTLSRKIFHATHHLKDEGDFSINQLQGFDLKGKTLGVIGTGKIGKNVIRMAKSFNMNIIAYDLYPDDAFAKENNFTYKKLEELIKEADIITLHAPCSKEDVHMINKENIKTMKKGVYLINTARGELIDTDALIWGLKEKIIAGAGLDVLEGERELKEGIDILSSKNKADRVKDYKTLLEDRVLIDMPNVIVTPHIAFYSKEAEAEIIKVTEENIQCFISGNVQNLVN